MDPSLAPSPETAETFRQAGMAKLRRRQFAAAARDFRAAAETQPDRAEAWLALARVQALAGDHAAAKASSAEAERLDGGQIRVHLFRARLARRTHEAPLQIAALRNAIRLRPDGVALRHALAAILLRRTNYVGALAAAKEALIVSPSDPALLLIVAQCHLGKGRLADAAIFLARAEERGADPAEAARLHADLDERRRWKGSQAAAGAQTTNVLPLATSRAPATPSATGLDRREVAPAPGRREVAAAQNVAAARPAMASASPTFRVGEVGASPAQIARMGERRVVGGIVDHLLIIRALILRDIALHHRNLAAAVLTGLVRPSIVVLAHYWLFYFLKKPMPGNIPLVIYVLAGFSTWFVFSGAWTGAETGGRWASGATLLPGVTDLHMRVAKAGWQFLLNCCFPLLTVVVLDLFGWDLQLPSIPQTFFVFVVAATMGFGIGLIIERLASVFGFVKTVGKMLTWLIFVTSGLYFAIGSTPQLLAYWFLYNPLLNLIETERNAFDQGYVVLLVGMTYPVVLSAVLLIAGLLIYRRMPCPIHE